MNLFSREPMHISFTNIDIMLDMRPTAVHQWLINQKEIKTGEKSTLDRNLPEDKIMELPVCENCFTCTFDVLNYFL
jgi:hypothetical protein